MTSLTALSGCLLAMPAWSQKYPITPDQTATAQKVSQAGVPLSALAPNAPDSYLVKSGDTLWAISKLFLQSPWRWPELWGMNMEEIRNPHLIYPGQSLVLDKTSGRAVLRNASAAGAPSPADTSETASTAVPVAPRDAADSDASGIPTVRLSPRTRYERFGGALSTLQTGAIEPFLTEPIIVEENELSSAARIVAAQENRVMLTRGDRAYARGPADAPLMDDKETIKRYRIFSNATPLKDPDSGEVLGYEAQFVGKAALMRSEMTEESASANGKIDSTRVPATIDILEANDEILVGYRMLPEPERLFQNYLPHAPSGAVIGRIVSVYGRAVVNAAQNQVVVINRGRRDGIENGHVMAILKNGERLIDRTDATRTQIKLPNERNGLLMVFKIFEKLSYALILDITDGVRVGDRLAAPE
jgi:LysM repeat protein